MSELIPSQRRRRASSAWRTPAVDRATELARTAVWSAAGPQAVRQTREFVVRRCAEWECPTDTTVDAGLVVDELMTSILLRSGPDVELTVAEWSGQLYLILRAGTGYHGGLRQWRERAHLNALAHRIVASLSRSWGELPPAGADGPGYWAVLDVDRPDASR